MAKEVFGNRTYLGSRVISSKAELEIANDRGKMNAGKQTNFNGEVAAMLACSYALLLQVDVRFRSNVVWGRLDAYYCRKQKIEHLRNCRHTRVEIRDTAQELNNSVN